MAVFFFQISSSLIQLKHILKLNKTILNSMYTIKFEYKGKRSASKKLFSKITQDTLVRLEQPIDGVAIVQINCQPGADDANQCVGGHEPNSR